MSNIDAWQKKPAHNSLSQKPSGSFFVGSLVDQKKNNSESETPVSGLTPPLSTAVSAAGSPKPKSRRCATCNKKLSLPTQFLCKCAGIFCTNHRFPDSHQCTFDHKEQWKKSLEEKNPQVVAEKISKI